MSAPDPDPVSCPRCGTPFAAQAFGGLCPRCLIAPPSSVSSSPLPQFEPLAPEEFDASLPDYSVSELIGRGGMGAVYRANQLSLHREVAIKLLAREAGADPEFAERFSREAEVTARLDHPSIVPVYDVGFDQLGRTYYTMRLVRGRELGEVIKLARTNHSGWSLPRIVGVLIRVSQTLAFAHGRGVVHRDLKPANIMIGDLGEVYIMDWGLAKVEGTEDIRDLRLQLAGSDLTAGALETIVPSSARQPGSAPGPALMTMDGTVVGTPAYMPPEQALNRVAEIDHLSDIYSLGAIIYELLAGHPPYSPSGSSTTALEVLDQLGRLPPSAVGEIDPTAPAELVAICDKAMSRDRDHRYRNALDLAGDLQAFIDGRVVLAHDSSALTITKKWVRRNRALTLSIAAAAVLAVLGLLATLLVQHFANRRITSALESEADAKSDALRQLTNSYANTGFSAAASGNHATAGLWMAQAALTSPDAPTHQTQRTRTAAWLRHASHTLRAIHLHGAPTRLNTHPHLPYALVLSDGWQIVDLEHEREILPAGDRYSAAWSPDGTRLATFCHGDDSVSVTSFPSGERIADVPCQVDSGTPVVTKIVFSPDGQSLAFGGNLGIRVWSLATSRRLLSFPRESDGDVTPWEFSPDSKKLIVGIPTDRTFSIYSLDPPYPTPVLGPFPAVYGNPSAHAILAPTFIADGTQIISHQRATHHPDSTGSLVWRDATSGKSLRQLDLEHPADISPDGRLLAYINGLEARVIELETADPVSTIVATDGILDLKFAPDGNHLIAGCGDRTAAIAKLGDLQFGPPLGHHHTPVPFVGFLGDSSLAVTVQRDGLVRLVDPSPGGGLHINFPLPDGGTTSGVTVHTDSRLLALTGIAHHKANLTTTRVFDLIDRQPAGPPLATGKLIYDAAFSPDGSHLAVACTPATNAPGELQLWDWHRGSQVSPPVPLPSDPRSLSFHPDGHTAAVWCGAGQALLVDFASNTATHIFDTPSWDPAFQINNGRIRFAPDGSTLIAWGMENHVTVWDVATRQHRFPPIVLDGVANGLDLLVTPGGGTIATVEYFGGSRNAARFHDLLTGAEVAPPIFHEGNLAGAAFSPDGSWLLTTGLSSKTAHLWDWQRGVQICPDIPHHDAWWSSAFVPDSPWFVLGGESGAVHLIDSESGKLVSPPTQYDVRGGINSLACTPDGRFIASGGIGRDSVNAIDLSLLLAPSGLTPEDDLVLARLNSSATIHPGGGITTLGSAAWHQIWQDFRSRNPTYHTR